MAISLAACRPQTAGQEHLDDQKQAPAAANVGECRLDLSGVKAVAVFRTLGMLGEYLGRQIVEGSDVVERFSVDEHGLVDAFRRLTDQLAREQQIETPSMDEAGGLITFHSRALAERLNSCYSESATDRWRQQGPNGTMVRGVSGSLPLTLFIRGGTVTLDPAGGESDTTLYRERSLAYLSGVWRRYQRGDDFVFANGQKKSALVGDLLHRLGARDVTIESTVGLIPQANFVHFTPTPLITEWLNQRW